MEDIRGTKGDAMTGKFKLQWPVDDHTITQYFGENPQVYAKFNQAGHEGVDFLAPVGANIYACADGQVFDVRSNDGNAYGIHGTRSGNIGAPGKRSHGCVRMNRRDLTITYRLCDVGTKVYVY